MPTTQVLTNFPLSAPAVSPSTKINSARADAAFAPSYKAIQPASCGRLDLASNRVEPGWSEVITSDLAQSTSAAYRSSSDFQFIMATFGQTRSTCECLEIVWIRKGQLATLHFSTGRRGVPSHGAVCWRGNKHIQSGFCQK